ncbi:hypothetical protein CFIMG_006351RA [Ceratocystis fimbriata CBS 114723]|uniref:Uncharacterized protein n=1 Tax=Ceratocystis fimbriata CBS 114723 TaxID=1035309 RepID=A0A2C5WUV0_9PEZI|nr:hypothetical protein CFIMG_006351RA [Ceratocystis fimbriata CBS 114723]
MELFSPHVLLSPTASKASMVDHETSTLYKSTLTVFDSYAYLEVSKFLGTANGGHHTLERYQPSE